MISLGVAVLDTVTGLVTAWGWEPRAVWEMPLWELAHWAKTTHKLAKRKPKGG